MSKTLFGAIAVLSITLGLWVASSSMAVAGEWNGPRGYIHGDDTTDLPAESICAFNGLDEPDDDPRAVDGDDEDWAGTPAGGHVQTGGQFVAMFGNLGLVDDFVAAGEFAGFGGDCRPGGGGH